jgi:hypothetical protein
MLLSTAPSIHLRSAALFQPFVCAWKAHVSSIWGSLCAKGSSVDTLNYKDCSCKKRSEHVFLKGSRRICTCDQLMKGLSRKYNNALYPLGCNVKTKVHPG